MRRIQVIDSHTGGEPTRVILDGGPELGDGPLSTRCARLRALHQRWRAAVVDEPRGSSALVGALLCAPETADQTAGVIFFNGVGPLGMCGHGLIGLVASLAHVGRIAPGSHRIGTPVGTVTAELHGDGRVTVENVPSRRHARAVAVEVRGRGRVVGDVAWGGNWFFIVREHGLRLLRGNLMALTDFSLHVREALAAGGVTGADGAAIDHVALVSSSPTPGVDGRGFVLCPTGAYDRSPCGTGTSALVACLAADGALAPGATWRQESLLGSVFEASYVPADERGIHPRITGSAHVTAEATLLLDERDPFCWGIGGA